ncbi:MAG: hypothetical protein LBS77_05240 [Desulfovibrio sp.]|nr:hypothetical protein [Desulfovibrio sp.]
MSRDSGVHTRLRNFYDTGDATAMMLFFERTVACLYPEEISRQAATAQDTLTPMSGYIMWL